MRHVWAPWRLEYILNKRKSKACIFCVRRSAGYQRRHFILAESACSFVMLNRYPYTAGHLMVIPRRHVADLENLTAPELSDFFKLVQFACHSLRRAIRPDGLNLGANLGRAAGAGAADHLHFHIVARWVGDHNFLPVVADTLALPELLHNTYQRLLPFFERANSTDDDPA